MYVYIYIHILYKHTNTCVYICIHIWQCIACTYILTWFKQNCEQQNFLPGFFIYTTTVFCDPTSCVCTHVRTLDYVGSQEFRQFDTFVSDTLHTFGYPTLCLHVCSSALVCKVSPYYVGSQKIPFMLLCSDVLPTGCMTHIFWDPTYYLCTDVLTPCISHIFWDPTYYLCTDVLTPCMTHIFWDPTYYLCTDVLTPCISHIFWDPTYYLCTDVLTPCISHIFWDPTYYVWDYVLTPCMTHIFWDPTFCVCACVLTPCPLAATFCSSPLWCNSNCSFKNLSKRGPYRTLLLVCRGSDNIYTYILYICTYI